MSDSDPGSEDVFDLERLRQLVELMKEHDLAQLDLRQGEERIQLQRGAVAGPYATAAPLVPQLVEPQRPAAADSSQPQEDDENVAYITSPMVGTFYSKPTPEAKTFVTVGDLVGPESTVCIVEAMKVFNEIPAEVSGRVIAVLVENEEPVEYGKPLFKIDTAS